MIYLAYIAFFFLSLQLFNVLINFVFRQQLKSSYTQHDELVSVLIPARNEEENIATLLEDLQKISASNIEIIVLDDQSTDKTSQVVKEYIKRDSRVKLLQSEGLPEGWLGKNHACDQLAKNAMGKYYTFIDADVRIEGDLINDAVDYLKKYHLGLLSIFPSQQLITLGEKLSVPVMNYILLTLLPLIFVRKSPFASHAAANGQFMLFDAAIYNRLRPHMVFKKSAVEDIEIARFLKKQKIKIACLTSEKRLACRMYQSYKEAVNGFSKNVLMFFGNKPVFAFLFWIVATLSAVPVLFSYSNYAQIYLAGIILTLLLYSAISRQNVFFNILFFPMHLIFLLLITINGIFIKTHKGYKWKERNIY